MFNFKINFLKAIKENLPLMLHTPIRLDRLKLYAKPFKIMHAEFLAKRKELFYKASTSSSIIYLEMALNDKFDKISRSITITDAYYDKVYLYKKSESKPPLIMYRKWQAVLNYSVGHFCVYNNLVYQANTAHINKIPGVDAEWTLTAREVPILRMRANYNGAISFFVNVPSSVSYDLAEMQAEINYYKLAGPGYLIRNV